jgi:hypothetical protein
MLTCLGHFSRKKLESGCVHQRAYLRAYLQCGRGMPRDLALKRPTYQKVVYGGEALMEPTHKRDVPFPAQAVVIRPNSMRWLCTAPAVSLTVQHHPSPCSPNPT